MNDLILKKAEKSSESRIFLLKAAVVAALNVYIHQKNEKKITDKNSE